MMDQIRGIVDARVCIHNAELTVKIMPKSDIINESNYEFIPSHSTLSVMIMVVHEISIGSCDSQALLSLLESMHHQIQLLEERL